MLDKYISDSEVVPVSILTRMWANQAEALTYKELRIIIQNGDVSEEDLENWSKDYSKLVIDTMETLWIEAIAAGQKNNILLEASREKGFKFDATEQGIQNWIKEHGTEFITDAVDEQRKAIQRLTMKAIREEFSPEELARVIRPCIGLNSRQAQANLRYYNAMKKKLRKEHPKMKEETIVRRARDKALKYAEKQHRYRAKTIAETEIAKAYSVGAHEGIKQAQEKGYMGTVEKIWVTARQSNVCKFCEAVEGVKKTMDEPFDLGKCGMVQYPPAHPRCRCVLKYVEVKEEQGEKSS